MAAGTSRRTVAKGMAWSVPVIGIGAAAPAMATSACPEIRLAETFVDQTHDRLTATNGSNSVTIPAGTTVTWQLQNLTTTARTITISNLTGLVTSPTPGVTTFSLPANGVLTVTFVTTVSWPINTSAVAFTYGNGSSSTSAWQYNSRLTLSAYPAPIAACPKASACASIRGSTPGTTCPTVAAPAAAGRAPLAAPSGPATEVVTDPRAPPPGWTGPAQ